MIDKKREITEKARKLYNEYGIRSVTMDDIVRELGISKKTLYQYFTDKSDLIIAALACESEQRMQEHKEAIDGSSNAIDQMLNFYDLQMRMIKDHNPALIYDLKKYYPKIHNTFLDKKRKGIYEGVLANLIQGKSEGLYRDDMDEIIISRLNLMRVEAFMNSGIFDHQEIMTKEFFEEMFTYHMFGIVSEKGRIVLEQNIDKLK